MAKSSTKRVRVLVNVSRAPAALSDALAQTSQWHRGRRLIELATLGLASEQSGLRVDVAEGGTLQLYAGISRIAGLLGEQVAPPSQEPPNPLKQKENSTIDEIVMPEGFEEQFGF